MVIHTEYSQGLRAADKLFAASCGSGFCGAQMGDSVEDADAGGESGSTVLRGDAAVVRERRAAGRAHSRAREAVQAELAKLRPIEPVVSIAAEKLRRERELVAARGCIAPKTAGKVATDEHTWQLFVEDQGLELENYPCTETVVEFAVSAERFRTMCDVCVPCGVARTTS